MSELNSQVVNEQSATLPVENANAAEKPKVSKLAKLRAALSDRTGYTKAELAVLSGLNPNTVNCQMYYHLPAKGFKIEKLADKKYRFAAETL